MKLFLFEKASNRVVIVVFNRERERERESSEVIRSSRLRGTFQFCCLGRCDANTAVILFDTTRDQSHQRLANYRVVDVVVIDD